LGLLYKQKGNEEKAINCLKEAIKIFDEYDHHVFLDKARVMVKKAGKAVGIHLRPHDLRRFCATYASREGTPIEIISKILLRHVHLSTTQRYL
jgi:integrase